MTWTVTLHPALTGEVASVPLSDQSDLLLQLLRLAENGGRHQAHADFPDGKITSQFWNFRFNVLHDCGYVIALSGSWVQHELCVLGLITETSASDTDAYTSWGETIFMRHERITKNSVEALSLQRFLDVFTPEQVDAAQSIIDDDRHHRDREAMIALATDLMRGETSELFNLGKAQQKRLEKRFDFMLERLRDKLIPVNGKVSLQIAFGDEIFTYTGLQNLPQQSPKQE